MLAICSYGGGLYNFENDDDDYDDDVKNVVKTPGIIFYFSLVRLWVRVVKQGLQNNNCFKIKHNNTIKKGRGNRRFLKNNSKKHLKLS